MPVIKGDDLSINAYGDRRLDRRVGSRLISIACLGIAVADIFHAQCLGLCEADSSTGPSSTPNFPQISPKCTVQNPCIPFFSHARQLPIEDVARRRRSAAVHSPQYLPGYGNLKPN